jgi:hypothetical protein
MKEYRIGGRIFFQKELTPGQWMQIIPYLMKMRLPEAPTAANIFFVLKEDLYPCMAIALREKGKKLKNKDLDELEVFLCETLEEEDPNLLTTLEVVDDFFDCNPIPLILQKLERLRGTVAKMWTASPDPSMTSLSSSAPEISPSETKSSGDIPSENASDSPSTGAVM